MANFIAGEAASAVVQELVGAGFSSVLGKRKEKASQEEYSERLETAAYNVERVFERAAKLPVVDVTVILRWRRLKRDYMKQASTLSKLRQWQAQQDQQEEVAPQPQPQPQPQALTPWSSFPHGWLTRAGAAMFAVSSFIGVSKGESSSLSLSSDDVERFELLALSAQQFLNHIVCSAQSLIGAQRMPFTGPLVSHLFQGKLLRYKAVEGSQERCSFIGALCLGERGVEAFLQYTYTDHKRVEKNLDLFLVLRLSESTDVVGIAVRCLESLESQFKLLSKPARRELTLLASSPDIMRLPCPPPVRFQEKHRTGTKLCRPDPVCCTASCHEPCANKGVASSDLSQVFPEEVIFLRIECYMSAPEYNSPDPSRSSSSGRNVMGHQPPPLPLAAMFKPHFMSHARQSFSKLGEDGFSKLIKCSLQQAANKAMEQESLNIWSAALPIALMRGTLFSNDQRTLLTDIITKQKQLTDYEVDWYSKHGAAFIRVNKDFPVASLKLWVSLLGRT